MNADRLIREIRERAEMIGGFTCEVAHRLQTLQTLHDILLLTHEPRGREALATTPLVTGEMWDRADRLTDLTRYGIYCRKELYLRARDRENIILVNCRGAVYYDSPKGYSLTLLKGSEVEVHGRGYAVVTVDRDKESKCRLLNEDGTAYITDRWD